MKSGRWKQLLSFGLPAVLLLACLTLSACGAAANSSQADLPGPTEAASPEPTPCLTPSPTPEPTPSPAPEPDYSFELFGQEVSTADVRVEFVRVPIGDEGLDELRSGLSQLRSCKYLLLDSCGISNENLAQLRDDYPEMKIVWRVRIEGLTFLTDVTVIHLANEIGPKFISDKNSSVLSYCTELEYLDLGHNRLSNIDFCAAMPHLRYLIMSYNYALTDLTPLENCPELEMAEFYFCGCLQDLSPLTACKNLKFLNVSATGVKDITPVYELKKLERFYCIMNYLDPVSQQDEIASKLPDCWATFEQTVAINVGWSYDEPKVRSEWYRMIYEIWKYNKEDWYFGYVDEA